jgi:hypothetical protein
MEWSENVADSVKRPEFGTVMGHFVPIWAVLPSGVRDEMTE